MDKPQLKKRQKEAITVEVEKELLCLVRLEASKGGFKLREVVEHALKLFLHDRKPK